MMHHSYASHLEHRVILRNWVTFSIQCKSMRFTAFLENNVCAGMEMRFAYRSSLWFIRSYDDGTVLFRQNLLRQEFHRHYPCYRRVVDVIDKYYTLVEEVDDTMMSVDDALYCRSHYGGWGEKIVIYRRRAINPMLTPPHAQTFSSFLSLKYNKQEVLA